MSDERDGRYDPQPAPAPGHGPPIVDLVIADLRDRAEFGRRKYGVDLRAGNTRDALRDAYFESVDQTCYLRQALAERDATPSPSIPPEPTPADRAIGAAAKGCYLMGRMPGKLGKPEIIIGFDEDRDAWGFLKAVAGAIKGYREGEETEG